MKLERSKEWWLAKARREGDVTIGAGALALDPTFDARVTTVAAPYAEDTRIAFGKFINMMRRRNGLSMEKLAEIAELEPSELLEIEVNLQYLPEPRTVYMLAKTFKVPQVSLMKLAGLSIANNASLKKEAVRFAARSESLQKLTSYENAALDAFVSVLIEQEPTRLK